MVVVRPDSASDVDEVRVDPRDVRQRPGLGCGEEVSERVRRRERPDVVERPRQQVAVDSPDRREELVRVPTPRRPGDVEVADERRQVVDGRVRVVAASRRTSGDGIEAGWESRAPERAETTGAKTIKAGGGGG